MIVDTHTHASLLWMEGIELLDGQMKANQVDKAVLLPLRDDFDLSYIIDCTRRFPGRFYACAAVDIKRSDATDVLAAQVAQGAVAVRIDAIDRSPGADPLALWAAAAALKLPISTLGSPEQFLDAAFIKVLDAFPQVPIILEHLAGCGPFWGPGRADKAFPMALYQGILALGKRANVYMKMPGLAEFTPRPRPMTNPPFDKIALVYEMAIDAFGASRLMWGSDFPPSANREGYRNALKFPRELVQFKSTADRDWVFGKTAIEVFKMGA